MGSKHRIARAKKNWEQRIERAQWSHKFVTELGYWNSDGELEDLLAHFSALAVGAWKDNYETIYEVDPDLLNELVDSELPDQEIPASAFRYIPHDVPLFVLPKPLEVVHSDMVAMYGQFMAVPLTYVDYEELEKPENRPALLKLFEKYKVNRLEDLPDHELLPRMIFISDPQHANEIKFIWFGHNREDVRDQIVTTQTIYLDNGDLIDLRTELGRIKLDLDEIGPEHRTEIVGYRDANWEEIAEQQFSIATALTLYVCSEEPDITEVELPAELKGIRHVKGSSLKVKNVGIRIGSALRKQRGPTVPSGSPESGRNVIPHIRKAHWHKFWTGPRDGDRKLIIKWLPPIPVNIEKGEIVSTVRPVKVKN